MPEEKIQPRILITGASGLVGTYFISVLKNRYDKVYVTCHEQMPNQGIVVRVDLSRTSQLAEVLEKIRPDIIINLAALTDVDRCEFDSNMATVLNRDLVYALSRYVAKYKGAYLLHISTDYVFDGSEGNYNEESRTNPINWYGKTKLGGESEIVRNVNESDWCIVRTSTPFGLHQKKLSFPLYVISKLRNNQSIKVLFDQYTSPTYGLNLGEMLVEIMVRRLTGIFHAAGRDRLSRYEQAVKLADTFNLNKGLIVRASMQEMDWKARRPKDSSLNVNKAMRVLHNKPQSFGEAALHLASRLQPTI